MLYIIIKGKNMKRKLVIVESPAKAKTIGRYLGEKYRIAASVGHIRDLPSSVMGVDIENDFTPKYIPMQGKNKVISELKSLASDCESVIIATDPDREGEAIGWHVAALLKIDPTSNCRITFNEITETAVKKAVESPRQIDLNRVNAQQARRILDRLVGYELSPLLWKKVKKGLSAGRVQSVTTKMIVDREEEIKAFKPEEYWNIYAHLNKEKDENSFRAKYHGIFKNGKVSVVKITNESEKNELLNDIKEKDFIVNNIKKGSKKKRPFAPYTTSTLQQDASRVLGFSSKKTMSVAQQLYEGVMLGELGQTALVTYIRTDSVRSSDDAVSEIRNIIDEKYGNEFVPKSPRMFKNKNKTQDGHEAIRPAHFDISPDSIKNLLNFDQYRLYKLIWNRFLASQMADANVNTVVADIKVEQHIFRASGETIIFPGFLILYSENNKSDENEDNEDNEDNDKNQDPMTGIIPELIANECLICSKINTEQKFTLPPARYTEASLIKALEEQGIGRPSTYAPTISTILDRKYTEKEGKHLKPTELGVIVTELLKSGFENIVDITFTAEMEKSLDKVEEGSLDWVELLKSFYPKFHQQVLNANKNIEKVKLVEKETGEKCPECNGALVEKDGRYGKFIACKNYPECKYSKALEEKATGKCPLCESGLLAKFSRKNRSKKFFVCDKKGKDPECPFISWYLPIDDKKCEICDSYMVMKTFRGKSYPKCSNKECSSNKYKKKKDGKES